MNHNTMADAWMTSMTSTTDDVTAVSLRPWQCVTRDVIVTSSRFFPPTSRDHDNRQSTPSARQLTRALCPLPARSASSEKAARMRGNASRNRVGANSITRRRFDAPVVARNRSAAHH